MNNAKPRRSLFQALKDLLRRLRRKQPPADPYSDRLVPVLRGPRGRSGAAVAEPEEESYAFFPARKP
jgi:hypothetical protein